MEYTHAAAFYRRRGPQVTGSQFDRPSQPGSAWEVLATDVPCAFDSTQGAVRLDVNGVQVRIAGTLFVHPKRLPAGVVIGPRDGVALTGGRVVSPGRFLVVEARLLGEGRFDDEMDLEATAEEFG